MIDHELGASRHRGDRHAAGDDAAGSAVFSPDFIAPGKGPVYLQLSAHISRAIASGQLASGDSLPSERYLAETLNVSRSTIAKALAHLRNEGRIVSVRGSGSKIASIGSAPPPRTVAGDNQDPPTRDWSAHGIVNLSASKFAAPSSLLGTMKAALSSAEAARILRSPGYSSLGLMETRQAIADHYTSTGFPTKPEQILVTTGAQQAIFLAAHWAVGQGEGVVVEDPTYSGALDAFQAVGAHLISVGFRPNGAHLMQLTANHWAMKARLIYLMPSYHNPTGIQLNDESREAVLSYLDASGATLIEDRALSHITLHGTPKQPLASLVDDDRALLVDSLSKVYWGGLRIGWVRSSESVIATLAGLKAAADLSGPLIDQAVAVELIASLQSTAHELSAVSSRRAELFCSLLRDTFPSWRFDTPSGGLSVWVTLPHGNALAFSHVAHEEGVDVVPGPSLSPSNRQDDCVRLTFAREEGDLREGVMRLANAWDRYSALAQATATSRVII